MARGLPPLLLVPGAASLVPGDRSARSADAVATSGSKRAERVCTAAPRIVDVVPRTRSRILHARADEGRDPAPLPVALRELGVEVFQQPRRILLVALALQLLLVLCL